MNRQFGWAVLVVLVMLVPLAFGQEAEVTAEAVEVAEVAPGLERPVDTDVMLLKNGDKLTGDVLNEEFSIRTSYADLTFNQESLAGIDLEDRINDMEVLITANDNRFSGFLDDSVFRFKLVTGPEIAVRREKVARVVFGARQSPWRRLTRSSLCCAMATSLMVGLRIPNSLSTRPMPVCRCSWPICDCSRSSGAKRR
jgi:hypothetical protein